MSVRVVYLFCALTLVLYPVAAQEDLEANRKRIRAAFETTRESDKRLSDYLYQRHVHRKEFSSDGTLKSSVELKYRRDPWEELAVTRLIERDGKPLTAEEQKKQEETLRKRVEEIRKGTTANTSRQQDEEQQFLAELPDALDFVKAGVETYDGREVEVYEFSPRKNYQPKNIRARVFEKVRGKIWVDSKDVEIAKLDALVFDTVNVGFGVLGRIEKGTHFELERRRVDGNQWLLTWQRIRFDVRVMMVKPLHREMEMRHSAFTIRPNRKTAPGRSLSAL